MIILSRKRIYENLSEQGGVSTVKNQISQKQPVNITLNIYLIGRLNKIQTCIIIFKFNN